MAVPLPTTRSGRNDIFLLVLGFAALVVVGASSLWLSNRNAAFSVEVAQTLEFKAEIVRMLSLAQDAETGQRGYLLTGDARYLEPYTNAVADIGPGLKRLSGLAAPEGQQRDRLTELEAAFRLKLGELAETIALQRAGKTAEAKALLETEHGRRAMTAIRRINAAMSEREDQKFAERSAEAAKGARLQLAVVLLGLVLAGALAYGSQVILRRQTKAIERTRIALAEANVGLEAAVQERTSELVSANEEIQRFAYIVSHDLRAPLVNVMGFTAELDTARKTLKDQIDAFAEHAPERVSNDAKLAVDEDLPEAIGFIRTSTAKMDRLINAILSLSREGRRVITPETIKVDAMVETIAETLRQQTWAADAEIIAEPGMPAIVTDRLSFEQVLQNLIENAVKYLDRSRPGRVVVKGRRMGPMVEYEIADNGRGIDAKDHERVFELFRRAGPQDQPGEGLGLAFVRASVRRLGGTIRLTSEIGKGSTFHLSFPAVIRPQTESRAA